MDNNSIIPETELQPEIEETAAEQITAEPAAAESAAPETTEPVPCDECQQAATEPIEDELPDAEPTSDAPVDAAPVDDDHVIDELAEQEPEAVDEPLVEEAAAPSRTKSKAPGKKKNTSAIIQIAAAVVIALFLLVFLGLCLNAKNLYDDGNYAEAKKAFEMLDFLPQFVDMPTECDYAQAGAYAAESKYYEAWELYSTIPEYKDSAQLAQAAFYDHALSLYNSGKYKESSEAFASMGDYEDAPQKVDDALYAWAQELYEAGEYDAAQEIFLSIRSYEDAADRYVDCQVNMAIALYRNEEYAAAVDVLSKYTNARDTANAYYYLCAFRQYNKIGTTMDNVYTIYNELEQYTDIQDVADALTHPFFYVARFFGAYWMSSNTYFTIDADYDPLSISHYLPWDVPKGSIWFHSDDKYCYFFIDDQLWFVIVGFDGFDQLHPDLMYVVGANGAYYDMYKYYDSLTGETLTPQDVVSASDVSGSDVFWTEELQEQLLKDIFGIVLSPTDVSGSDISATDISGSDISYSDVSAGDAA